MLDVARSHHGNGGLPVEPEVSKLRGTALLCIYGASDRGAICEDLATAGLARALRRPGGHVVGGQEGPGLVKQILAEVQAPQERER